MADERTISLADCSDYRQTLLVKPPRIVHGTALLMTALVAAAVGWAAWTQAELVVRANGRVRPVDEVTRVFTPSDGELDGRVAEVCFQEGDVVETGQLLVRLDTQKNDNRIAELEARIAAAERESAELERQEELLQRHRDAALAKAKTELAQAEENLRRAEAEQQSRIRQAQAEQVAKEDVYSRMQNVSSRGGVSQQQLVQARAEVLQAREQLQQAELPLDRDEVKVLRHALDAIRRDFAVREAELSQQQVVKRGQAEAAGKELANLKLARSRCELRSPVQGVVVSGCIKAGDVLESGKSVVEIAPGRDLHFEAVTPAADVGDVALGMPVKIKLDAFDYQQYGVLEGEVCFIAPDSHMPQGGDEARLAYLVRVKLHGDSVGCAERRGQVKLGMGATAEIITDRRSLLEIFLRRIRRTISLG